jgi:hypothetical protein
LTATYGAPFAKASTEKINFPDMIAGTTKDTSFSMSNTGTENLILSYALIDGPFKSEYSTSHIFNDTIAPGKFITVPVSFSPLGSFYRYARLLVYTNDPQRSRYSIGLTSVVMNNPNAKQIIANLNGEEAAPTEFALKGNYPNPFNPTTTISYAIPENGGAISIKIYNSIGQEVKTLIQGKVLPAGIYSVTWDGKDNRGNIVSSGIYFTKMITLKSSIVKKMIMMK